MMSRTPIMIASIAIMALELLFTRIIAEIVDTACKLYIE